MWADIAAGMAERQETDLRQRGELARAFSEFRAANPEATFAEFQSFIDAMSGGRNYLRGGAPSRDVLQGIATENATRKSERMARERLADARAKAEFRGQLEAQIDDALLGMEGDDYGRAISAFTESLGGDLGGLDITGMFTPARRQRAVMSQLAQSWPTLSSMMETMDPEKMDAKTLAQMSGMPLPVAEAALAKHRTAAERETQTYLQRNRSALIEAATTALERGLDPVAAAEALAGEQGMTLPKDFAASLTDEAERRKTQADEERKRAKRREMLTERQQALAFVLERAEKGQDIRPLLADYFDVDPATMPEDVVSGMIESFNREKEKREADEKRAVEDRVSQHQLNLETRVAEHQAITAALALGDSKQAEAQVARLIAAMPSDVRANLPADYAQQLVAERLAQMQAAQDAQIEERRLQTQQSAIEAGANIDDDSRAFAAEQARHLPEGPTRVALLALADQFVIDGRALAVVGDAVGKLEPGATVEQVQQAAAQALTSAGVPTIDQARTSARDRVMRAAGAVEQDMTFDQYLTTMRGDVEELRTGAMALIDRAAQSKDPEQAMRLLEQAQGALVSGASSIADTVQLDQRNARQIITVGTAGWDQKRVEADVLGALTRAQAEIERKLQQTRARVAHRAAEQEAARAAAVPAAKADPAPQAGRTPAEAMLERVTADYAGLAAQSDLAHAVPQTRFGWARDWFTMDEDEYARQKRTSDFVANKAVRQRVRENPALADEMLNHPGGPIGWAEANRGLEWVREVLSDLTS